MCDSPDFLAFLQRRFLRRAEEILSPGHRVLVAAYQNDVELTPDQAYLLAQYVLHLAGFPTNLPPEHPLLED